MGIKVQKMRPVKVFVISVVVMMGFFGVVTFFLPSKVTVSKSVLINATETEVTKEIENFNKWKDWYPGFQNQEIGVTSLQMRDSAFVILTGEKVRKWSMVLSKRGPENIDILLFEEGKKKNVTWQFILSPGRRGQTRLMWNINTTFPWYPWKKIRGIFLDKVTGPRYQEILQNLKMAVEKTHKGFSP